MTQEPTLSYEIVEEALDNSRHNSDGDDGRVWFADLSSEALRDDLMHKCSEVEDADPEVVLHHVLRYRRERRV